MGNQVPVYEVHAIFSFQLLTFLLEAGVTCIFGIKMLTIVVYRARWPLHDQSIVSVLGFMLIVVKLLS